MIGPKAYIHLSRLEQNIFNIQRNIGERNLMIVVKANGYGHGSINIANTLSKNSALIFCVFAIDEAIKLRENGIKNPILIFSRIHKAWIDLAVKYNLWVNACHIDDLKLLDKFYNEKSRCPDIHLKFEALTVTFLRIESKIVKHPVIVKSLLNSLLFSGISAIALRNRSCRRMSQASAVSKSPAARAVSSAPVSAA